LETGAGLHLLDWPNGDLAGGNPGMKALFEIIEMILLVIAWGLLTLVDKIWGKLGGRSSLE
jgi:hypothetical protein